MKTLTLALLLLVMFVSFAYTQTEEPAAPETPVTQLDAPTIPADPPSAYTENYGLRMYQHGAYPSADSLNQNLMDIDGAIRSNRSAILFLCMAVILLAVLVVSQAYKIRKLS